MSASESLLTPAQVFGRRLRELRQRRGWNQRQLAERAAVDRTTVNKIEQGARSDVSISQLFAFAEVLGTTPINLLTPSDPTATIQISPGGRVLLGSAARAWIRGTPAPEADPLDYFFDLPADEQREAISRIVMSPREDDEPSDVVMRRMWWFGDDEGREEYLSRVLSDLRSVIDGRRKDD